MTQAIVAVARPLGIAVHDHIIVGKDGYASLKGLRQGILGNFIVSGTVSSRPTKVIRLAERPPFGNFTPKTVRCTCRPALSSVTTHWTSSAAISEPRIPTMFIRLMAHQFGTPGVGFGAKRRNAPLHWCGLHRRRRQDRGSLCLPRRAPHVSQGSDLFAVRQASALGAFWRAAKPTRTADPSGIALVGRCDKTLEFGRFSCCAIKTDCPRSRPGGTARSNCRPDPGSSIFAPHYQVLSVRNPRAPPCFACISSCTASISAICRVM